MASYVWYTLFPGGRQAPGTIFRFLAGWLWLYNLSKFPACGAGKKSERKYPTPPIGKEISMPLNPRLFLFLPVAVALLSACGGTPTPKPELLVSTAPAAAFTNTPSPTQPALPTSTPTTAVTLPPAAPTPGLVFIKVGNDAASLGLWIVQADGQSKQLSTKSNPRLSPDQKQVVYSENGDIWLTDLGTGKNINLTRTNDKVETDYQWWPARPGIIVFHYQFKNDIQPIAGYPATVKTDGTNYLVIDEEIGSNSPAALSPDGQSIAYDRGGIPWVYNFTGGMMPIFPKSFPEKYRIATNPAWSPDSRKIAWQLFGDQTGSNGWSGVAVLDLDTLQVMLLHRYTVLGGSDVGNYHLAWSSDGTWLAVANQTELAQDGKVSLWVMRPDGSEEHHIGNGDHPVWSPDGEALIFLATSGVFAVKTGEWNPYQVTLPADSQVIDWVKLK
jgi:Tol biopolymer transport system component